ncbi:MAG: hypothetical protein KKC38_02220 [Nanoarchaeota archaeon]|nr:hypothetical protein [Nanoarchaeota archaeon]
MRGIARAGLITLLALGVTFGGYASAEIPVSESIEVHDECDCLAMDGAVFQLIGFKWEDLTDLQTSLDYFESARDCFEVSGKATNWNFDYWSNLVEGDIHFLEEDYDEALVDYLDALDQEMNMTILEKLRNTQSMRSKVQPEREVLTFEPIRGMYKPVHEIPIEETSLGRIKAVYR